MQHHMANVKFCQSSFRVAASKASEVLAPWITHCSHPDIRKVTPETFARVITEVDNCTKLYRLCIVRNGGHIEHVL